MLTAARWAFTSLGAERLEWRAETGNVASRAVALRAGFRLEGEQRSGLLNKGVRRDAWTAALLPSDLGLAGAHPYLPGRRTALPAGPRTPRGDRGAGDRNPGPGCQWRRLGFDV